MMGERVGGADGEGRRDPQIKFDLPNVCPPNAFYQPFSPPDYIYTHTHTYGGDFMFSPLFIDYTSRLLDVSPMIIRGYLEAGLSPRCQLDLGRFRVLEVMYRDWSHHS